MAVGHRHFAIDRLAVAVVVGHRRVQRHAILQLHLRCIAHGDQAVAGEAQRAAVEARAQAAIETGFHARLDGLDGRGLEADVRRGLRSRAADADQRPRIETGQIQLDAPLQHRHAAAAGRRLLDLHLVGVVDDLLDEFLGCFLGLGRGEVDVDRHACAEQQRRRDRHAHPVFHRLAPWLSNPIAITPPPAPRRPCRRRPAAPSASASSPPGCSPPHPGAECRRLRR